MVSRIQLPAGNALTVTADVSSTGLLRRQEDSGAAASYAAEAIAASSTTVKGPFSTARGYEITILTGALTYSFAPADATDSSADLASDLSDETGTGAAVFGTDPVIKLPVTNVSASGALTISSGVVKITKSSAIAALTLAAPTAAQEGTILRITSTTARAHTITATGLLNDGTTGGPHDLATFAAFAGASVTLVAIALKWHVLSANLASIS